LQRVLVDFGADHAFGQVPDKMKEHYGIELCVSTIRHLTEHHAQRVSTAQALDKPTPYPTHAGSARLILETDGSMIPIVEVDADAPDKRKHKTESWKEARLCLAHEHGKTQVHFGGAFQESVDTVGNIMFHTACQAGFGRQTYLHAVGDGAVWLADQVETQFGDQGHYLLDFYHACEYLGDAAVACAGDTGKTPWLEQQKTDLKQGRSREVLDRLTPFLAQPAANGQESPALACHRYLSNRLTQLDYPRARALGLPIGSGEIESAHRYVIQKRLKLSGAWWKEDNAKNMLALRILRANHGWGNYWGNLREAA
jgi:hypothetical protein